MSDEMNKKLKWIEYNPATMPKLFETLKRYKNAGISIEGYFNGSTKVEKHNYICGDIWWNGKRQDNSNYIKRNHIIPIKLHFRDDTWCYGMKIVEEYDSSETRRVENYIPYARCGKNGKNIPLDDSHIISFQDLHNLNSVKEYKLRKFFENNDMMWGNQHNDIYTANPFGIKYGEIPFAKKMGKRAWTCLDNDKKIATLWKYVSTNVEVFSQRKTKYSIISFPDILMISNGDDNELFNNMDATLRNDKSVNYFKEGIDF